MAEGGVDRHNDSQSASTDVHSLDYRLLECPICLEQLRQPKSLPCLHCFCQKCLCTFIIKDLSGNTSQNFKCPVCRRVTQPVDPSEKKENWAKQFPTNNVIEELIKIQKKNHTPIYCNLKNIVVEKQPRRVPSGTEYLTIPLSERRVKEIGKFSIKGPLDNGECWVNGVVYLPDNYIVVGDVYNKKLKLYTDKGQYLDELKIKGSLYDLCMVDSNTVAVAVYNPGIIHVVNVQSSKLSLLYRMNSPDGNRCCGITHTNGEFIVSTPTQICRMTQDGKSDLLHTLSAHCYSLTNDPKHGCVYASQWESTSDTAVYRLTGKTKTDMKVDVVETAWGVDIDKEGNVYVCGYYSHNVVQLSSDGTNIRELLTSSDGVNYPVAIAVCDDKFVVTNIGNKRNYVHVYSLY